VEFTPHVTSIPLTPTPPATIGCPPGLATYHGDEDYGWGEIAGRPDLALIWITDGTGTHYVIVSADDPQLQGSARVDDFADLIEAREAAQTRIDNATGEGNATGVGAGVVIGLLMLCPESFGLTCVGAGLAVGGGAIINILRNQALREQAQEDLELAEFNIIGRYNQILQTLSSGS
jgi:hypothetical protein